MKRIFFTLVFAACTMLLAACNSTSSAPIGRTPAKLDPEQWKGRWRTADNRLRYVQVTDASQGVMQVSEVEDGSDGIHLQNLQVLFRQEGNALLYNLVSVDPGDPAKNQPQYSYMFGRIVLNDNTVVLWPCRNEALQKLIDQRVITGLVEEGKSVHVTGGFDALAKRLAAPEGWLLLDLNSPVAMFRDRPEP